LNYYKGVNGKKREKIEGDLGMETKQERSKGGPTSKKVGKTAWRRRGGANVGGA